MKRYFYLSAILILLLSACTATKNVSKTTEDKTLLSALKKFEKNPSDIELRNSIVSLYNFSAKSHLDKIEIYNTLTDPDKWIKIVTEYEALIKLYETVHNSSASKLIGTNNFAGEILNAKQNGADDFYTIGMTELKNDDKPSARKAFYALRQANQFVPGYKNVREQIKLAFEKSVIKVIINPVRDNTFFYNSMGWNNYGNNYNNDYFQRSLVNDLGGSNNKNQPALFYTDWDARRQNIVPDWQVELTWLTLDIPMPMSNQYSRNITRQVEISRDTSGKVLYETYTATLYITKKYFTASADMEVRITDLSDGRNITTNRYSDQFNWEQQYATYSGDSRALSGNEYALLNNNNYQEPGKEEILNRLSQQIYPQIKNRIATVTGW